MPEILDGRQASLFRPESDWRPPTELPDLTRMEYVSLDTETYDPNLKERGAGWCRGDGYICGVSVSWPHEGKAKAVYMPFKHQGDDNLSEENVKDWLNYFFKNFNGTLIGMNAIYDLGWLLATGIDLKRIMSEEIKVRDVMFSQALLDENRRSYSLAAISEAYGLPPKDETLLNEAAHSYGVDSKSGIFSIAARYVGPYAEMDAKLPLIIWSKQKKLIEESKLEKVTDLEHSLLPCLLSMKMKGVRVNVAKAEEHRETFLKNYQGLLKEIKDECGLPIEVFSADSVAVGFNKLSISYPKTGTGRASFTDPWLSSHPSKLAKLVTLARKQQRAAETFCKGMVLDKAVRGRVHCEFHPLRSDDGGTVSGRLSSSMPNLQQLPARDPQMGALIRGLFLPELEESWLAADWAGQEPRLLVNDAERLGCTKAKVAADRYRTDPKTDYHGMVAELVFGAGYTKQQRTACKTLNLGIFYGMGAAKLCKQLGLSTKMVEGKNGRQYEVGGEEGQALMNRYHQMVPFVKEVSQHYQNLASTHGAIRTISGRLCRFPMWESFSGGRAFDYEGACRQYGSSNIRRAFCHKALNRRVQGSAADTCKVAMRDLFRAGFTPLVTIHDEFGMSVKDKKEAKQIVEIMENCVKLKIPMVVDCDYGASWGEAKPMVEDEEI
jgi:DNA polymerase I-like protein with 3'-5' exonuclease and polymerase domains